MKRRALAFLWALVLTAGALAGCGASGKSEAASADSAVEAPMAMAEDMGTGGTSNAFTGAAVQTEAKRIYTANLELETTGFDGAVSALTQLAEDCGGWMESSSVNNQGGGYRSANYTVRVPMESYRDFVTRAGALCHTLYSSEYVEDVSEAYYDAAGRLETQRIKLERLQALLAKAEVMEDIITLESAISETEQQIDSLSGTVQHYDALVEYATVELSLREVYKLSNVEEPATGFASRLGAAFVSGWNGFVSGMEGFLVTLAYGWMWLVLLAAVAVPLGLRLGKKRGRIHLPRRKKPDDKAE